MSAEPPAKLTPPISDRDHTKGPSDSIVTLVEYGDYECPYCGQAQNAVHEIQERTSNAVRLILYNASARLTDWGNTDRASEVAMRDSGMNRTAWSSVGTFMGTVYNR